MRLAYEETIEVTMKEKKAGGEYTWLVTYQGEVLRTYHDKKRPLRSLHRAQDWARKTARIKGIRATRKLHPQSIPFEL